MRTLITLAMLASTLAACSTPSPVSQQANHTVGLMAELNKSIDAFNQQQAALAGISLTAIRDQEAQVAQAASQALIADAIGRASHDRASREVQEALTAVADAFASAANRETDGDGRWLLRPAPTSGSNTVLAQKAVASMATDLTDAARLAELRSYLMTVRAGVQQNKDKIKAIEPVQELP